MKKEKKLESLKSSLFVDIEKSAIMAGGFEKTNLGIDSTSYNPNDIKKAVPTDCDVFRDIRIASPKYPV